MEYKKIYKEAVDELNPSLEFTNKVKTGKEIKMRKLNKRNIVVIAVAACMMLGTTAFAASRISEYRVWGDPGTATSDYQITQGNAEELEITLGIPEGFSNGYEFHISNINGMDCYDDNGNVMAEGGSLVVTYTKSDCPDIQLYVDPLFEAGDYSEALESKEINGVNVYYSRDIYKFVPPDYELTEEDQQNMESGHYNISYGSGEVEVKVYEGIFFENDNKIYNMFCWDGMMTPDEWFDMAEELLK